MGKGIAAVLLLGLLAARPAGSAAIYDRDLRVDSWLSDSAFPPAPEDPSEVLITTQPDGFYYNVLVEVEAAMNLTVRLRVPAGCALWDDTSVHVYLNGVEILAGDSLNILLLGLNAGDQLYVNLQVRPAATQIPAHSLPRVYTFSASASGGGFHGTSFARMTGVPKF